MFYAALNWNQKNKLDEKYSNNCLILFGAKWSDFHVWCKWYSLRQILMTLSWFFLPRYVQREHRNLNVFPYFSWIYYDLLCSFCGFLIIIYYDLFLAFYGSKISFHNKSSYSKDTDNCQNVTELYWCRWKKSLQYKNLHTLQNSLDSLSY